MSSCTFRKQSTASLELNISGVTNIVLLQNTLSCKRLNQHPEQGNPYLSLWACWIMNWIASSPALTPAMSCCSPGWTLGLTHYLFLSKTVNKPCHCCHMDPAWSCVTVPGSMRALPVQWSPSSPSSHPLIAEQLCSCNSLIQPVPNDSLDRHSLSTGKQGIDRRPECFLVSCFEGIQVCLNVCHLHRSRMCKTKVQVSYNKTCLQGCCNCLPLQLLTTCRLFSRHLLQSFSLHSASLHS